MYPWNYNHCMGNYLGNLLISCKQLSHGIEILYKVVALSLTSSVVTSCHRFSQPWTRSKKPYDAQYHSSSVIVHYCQCGCSLPAFAQNLVISTWTIMTKPVE